MTSTTRLRRDLDEYYGLLVDARADEPSQRGDYPASVIWTTEDRAALFLEVAQVDASGVNTPVQHVPIFEFAPEADYDAEAALGSDLDEQVRRALLIQGTDALAWYASFHVRGPQWGIYLPVTSLTWVAERVFGQLGLPLGARLGLAAHVLHSHELFHFAVDYMTAIWECATSGYPCWLPAREFRKPAGYFPLEEKLANAFMLRRLSAAPIATRRPGRLKAVRRFVDEMPEGYRDGLKAQGDAAFHGECLRLVYQYIHHSGRMPGAERVCGALSDQLLSIGGLDWRQCPVHVVQDGARFSLPELHGDLFDSVHVAAESEEFLRDLDRLGVSAQKAWGRTKEKLRHGLAAKGLDFKRWKAAAGYADYSVRLDRNIRAHLRHSQTSKTWVAVSVGTHKDQGHG